MNRHKPYYYKINLLLHLRLADFLKHLANIYIYIYIYINKCERQQTLIYNQNYHNLHFNIQNKLTAEIGV